MSTKDKDKDKDKDKIKDKNRIKDKFMAFYESYPRKVKKDLVEKWFDKNEPDDELFETMLQSLEKFKNSYDWIKDNGQFIPYPSSWLNQKRWEDEIEEMKEKEKEKEEWREEKAKRQSQITAQTTINDCYFGDKYDGGVLKGEMTIEELRRMSGRSVFELCDYNKKMSGCVLYSFLLLPHDRMAFAIKSNRPIINIYSTLTNCAIHNHIHL